MKYEYKVKEEDFLAFQLFAASKSTRIYKKIRNNRIILSFVSFLLCFLAYTKQSIGASIYLGSTAVLLFIFYPMYFKWQYKKKSIASLKASYANQFDELSSIKFESDHLLVKNKTGEGKVLFSEIEEINETEKHFFVKMSNGSSVILPKDNIENLSVLKKDLSSLNKKITEELAWKW